MKNDAIWWEFVRDVPEGLIEKFLADTSNLSKSKGTISTNNQLNEFRQVTKQNIPEFQYFSLMLYAYGMKANEKVWQFDITSSKQCELLTYGPEGDRYDGHVDLERMPNGLVRKLTVIAFLNEDYEGGRFYFQNDVKNKQYINAKKGTVIVFPSYIMHGVEPVTAGERKSCVTWLLGPDFK